MYVCMWGLFDAFCINICHFINKQKVMTGVLQIRKQYAAQVFALFKSYNLPGWAKHIKIIFQKIVFPFCIPNLDERHRYISGILYKSPLPGKIHFDFCSGRLPLLLEYLKRTSIKRNFIKWIFLLDYFRTKCRLTVCQALNCKLPCFLIDIPFFIAWPKTQCKFKLNCQNLIWAFRIFKFKNPKWRKLRHFGADHPLHTSS